MISFIDHIVNELEIIDHDSLKDKCYVFPSRRASLYFINSLQIKFADKAIWSPSVYSIEEFVQEHAKGLTVIDSVKLLFLLYKVYRKEGSTMEFDVFQNWGQTLLKDFDEIDRYLVDGSLLYKNLQEIDDIEAVFGQSEEVIAAIRSFQEVITASEEGKIYNDFKKTWSFIGKVYKSFKTTLLAEGYAYNGMCYREIAEKLQEDKLELPYDQVIFAGFNALSRAEEVIIDSLLSNGKAKVYFDAERYYLEDEVQEAGYFLRKLKKKYRNNPNINWVISNGFNEPKKINIIGVEQKTAQPKVAADVLKASGPNVSNTAIIMADETLLLPMMYALPSEIEDVNITMGYPTSGTDVAELVLSYFRYLATNSTSKDGNKTFVSRKALIDLTLQGHIAKYVSQALRSVLDGKSNFVLLDTFLNKIETQEHSKKEILELLFIPTVHHGQAIDNIINVLAGIYYSSKEEGELGILEEGITVKVIKYLQELKLTVSQAGFEVNFELLERITKDSFKQLSAPFSGEPLADLQIMGFLESRSLDFDHIIITSVNEELLPSSTTSNSYIPFGIRKAFKMPTFLEHNSLYAYHFFRLLQRASEVTLIYSTRLSVTGSGEKSRFILQLLNEFDHHDSIIKVNQQLMTPPLHKVKEAPPIIIHKNDTVHALISAHFANFTLDKPLSPTSLTDYISCSLKYYFARILKIKEPDIEADSIDARTFGNIFHEAIESVFAHWVGKELSNDDVKSLIKNNLKSSIDNAFKDYDAEDGEIKFTRHVIENLVRKILENDILNTPFTILDLESKQKPLHYNLSINSNISIPIGGIVDRFDQISINSEEVLRVIDYKTGFYELKSPTYNNKPVTDQDYIQRHFEDTKIKSGFQLLFYILVLHRMNPSKKITGGIIGIKNINQGIEYLRDTTSPVSDELVKIFEGKLVELITEIMNPEVPFEQTDDEKQCEYCQYKRICRRV